MPLIKLQCPNCGGQLKVDSDKDAAICEYCGQPYIVKDAIVKNYIASATIIADVVNVYSEKDFKIVAGILESYSGESSDVVIPDNVIEIAEACFENIAITSVKIPDSVEIIRTRAFNNCHKLISVTIGNGVKLIESFAFFNCENLSNIYLGNNLKEVGEQAFANCSNINRILFPNTVEYIGKLALQNCKSLDSVSINANTVVGDRILEGCMQINPDTSSFDWTNSKIFEGSNLMRVFRDKNGLCPYCGGVIKQGFMGKKECKRCHKVIQ